MHNPNSVFSMPASGVSRFGMIDIGAKRPTRRVAVASGVIVLGDAAFAAVRDGTLPKGDVLALAEAAAIGGAKKTPDSVPMCHTVPLDMAGAHFMLDPETKSITAIVQCVAHAKTGVEMEALAGVQAALLTIWDLTKGTNPALRIEDVRLLVKTGGKSGVWINPQGIPDWLRTQLPPEKPMAGIDAAVLVMSDRAAKGTYKDQSGALLVARLEEAGADIAAYQIIADDADAITQTIPAMIRKHAPQILLASGGTGPGQRDVTPDILPRICDRMLEGVGEWLRRESGYFTETAWLSRMSAGMLDETLIIALPGSPKAVAECWQILAPVLPSALARIDKQRHPDKEAA